MSHLMDPFVALINETNLEDDSIFQFMYKNVALMKSLREVMSAFMKEQLTAKGKSTDDISIGADDQIPFLVQMCLDYMEKNAIDSSALQDKMLKIFDKVQALSKDYNLGAGSALYEALNLNNMLYIASQPFQGTENDKIQDNEIRNFIEHSTLRLPPVSENDAIAWVSIAVHEANAQKIQEARDEINQLLQACSEEMRVLQISLTTKEPQSKKVLFANEQYRNPKNFVASQLGAYRQSLMAISQSMNAEFEKIDAENMIDNKQSVSLHALENRQQLQLQILATVKKQLDEVVNKAAKIEDTPQFKRLHLPPKKGILRKITLGVTVIFEKLNRYFPKTFPERVPKFLESQNQVEVKKLLKRSEAYAGRVSLINDETNEISKKVIKPK